MQNQNDLPINEQLQMALDMHLECGEPLDNMLFFSHILRLTKSETTPKAVQNTD